MLWPGQLLEFDGSGKQVREEDFWRIPDHAHAADTTADELAAMLEESVRLHLASDVPLACSCPAASIRRRSPIWRSARRNAGAHLHAGLRGEGTQRGAVRKADRRGDRHGAREIVLTERQFVAKLDAAMDRLDQPTFDGLNSYFMSQAVHEAGFTVALAEPAATNCSADTPRSANCRCCSAGRIAPASCRAIGKSPRQAGDWPLRRAGAAVPPQTRWAKLPEMARRGQDLLALYQLAYALFLPEYQRELLAHGWAEVLPAGCRSDARAAAEETGGRPPWRRSGVRAATVPRRAAAARHRRGQHGRLDGDAAAAGRSGGARGVNRLPEESGIQPMGLKSMLRRIGLRGLDPELFDRPKCGFVLPFDRWMRRAWASASTRRCATRR